MDRTSFGIPAHAEHYSVVLLKARGRGGPFVVQKRAKGRDIVYAGRLGLVGGRLEGDEAPHVCALREVEEETGLDLNPNDISLLARLLATDEFGNLSFGHIYFAEDLSPKQVNAALRFRCKEGEVRLLRRDDIGRRWRDLTSITGYAFSAFFDFEKVRAEQEAPATPLAALGKWLRGPREA